MHVSVHHIKPHRDPCLGECEFEFNSGRCFTGGGSGGGGSAPANTTSQNTTTYIQDVPNWEQQYLSNLLGQASTEAQQPYQQFPGTQVAPLTSDQTQSFSNIENLANNGSWQPTQNAGIMSAAQGANTANNIAGAGSPYYQASAGYNPLAAASPFLGAAANTATPQGISQYLSPYTGNVVQGLVNTANQEWNQTLMPSINDSFVGSGQYGSGRNAQVLGQQANNFETNLNTSVANALQSGYGQASTNAANQAGLLGSLGNTAASATGAQAANLQGAGAGLGNLAATQSSAQQAAGANLANVGNTALNSGITANAALQDVGQQQQQQSQNNINVAEQNFTNQNQWPETQTSFLSDIIRGLPAMGTSGTQATQTPTTNNMIGSVSPLSTLAGTLLGAGGVGNVSGSAGAGTKKGGLIKGFAAGGLVDPPTPDQIDSELQHPGEQVSPLQMASAQIPSSTQLPANPYSAPERPQFNPLQAANDNPANDNQERGLQLLAMARGFLTPAHSGTEAFGNALGGLEGSIYKQPVLEQAQQQVVGGGMANQMSALGLQRAQAMQPFLLSQMSNLGGMSPSTSGTSSSDSGGGPSVADQAGAQALRWAYMGGKPEDISKAYLSLYEHNPQLAGAIKAAQEGETIEKTPQGTFAKGKDLVGPGTKALAGEGSTDQAQTADVPVASDGKPVLYGLPSISAPDPTGMPSYRTPNTETGVGQTKIFQEADNKANEAMNANLSSLQSEQFRLKELGGIYKDVHAGTLVAQNPEFFNKLAAIGFADSPDTIKQLGGTQAAMQNHILQIINQIKDTNANLGGAPTRTFGSEIHSLMEEGENPGNQPGGLFKVLTEAKGMVDHHIDMVKGWNAIGGLGNRAANGYTMRPDDYVRQWSLNHNIDDYKQAAEKEIGPLKGMEGNPNVTKWMIQNGKLMKVPALTGGQ